MAFRAVTRAPKAAARPVGSVALWQCRATHSRQAHALRRHKSPGQGALSAGLHFGPCWRAGGTTIMLAIAALQPSHAYVLGASKVVTCSHSLRASPRCGIVVRAEEAALLNADDAHDMFSKTMGFTQVATELAAVPRQTS